MTADHKLIGLAIKHGDTIYVLPPPAGYADILDWIGVVLGDTFPHHAGYTFGALDNHGIFHQGGSGYLPMDMRSVMRWLGSP